MAADPSLGEPAAAVQNVCGGAETWHRLQAAYDLAQAMKRAGRIKVARIRAAAASSGDTAADLP